MTPGITFDNYFSGDNVFDYTGQKGFGLCTTSWAKITKSSSQESGIKLGIKDGIELGSYDGTKLGVKDGIKLGLDDSIKDDVKLGSDDGIKLGINHDIKLGSYYSNEQLR
eukprot:14454608-Ditylum_brightwellii.AAC.1